MYILIVGQKRTTCVKGHCYYHKIMRAVGAFCIRCLGNSSEHLRVQSCSPSALRHAWCATKHWTPMRYEPDLCTKCWPLASTVRQMCRARMAALLSD